jgi:hypothetical protein
MTRFSRAHLYFILSFAAITLLVGLGLLVLIDRGRASDNDLLPPDTVLATEGASIDVSSAQVRGTTSSDGVDWSLVTYESSQGSCLEVHAELNADEGNVGGCGASDDPLFSGMGGMSLEGQWYNVSFGRLPEGAVSVNVSFADGTSTHGFVAGEVWMVAQPAANPTDGSKDLDVIEAIDESGNVVDSVNPPSLSAYARAAQE